MKQVILVGLGGAAGSILRYLTSLLTTKYATGVFPFATLTVNILGCILLGLFMGYIDRHLISNPAIRLLVITGFCGGYTTFSAFAFENFTLFQSGNILIFLANILASIVFGILGVWLGYWMFTA